MRASNRVNLILIILGVFLLSFVGSFFAIQYSPIGTVKVQLYSTSEGSGNYNSSTGGGAWENQILSLSPKPGAINVPRDSAIWIDEPRPVTVQNISISPEVPIAKITDQHYEPPSADIMVYPAGLLQPNTTYNITAVVADTPSWWIFATSSEPNEAAFGTMLSHNNVWIAFGIAFAITVIVSVTMVKRKAGLN